jgi:hypothetical protein
MVRLNHICSQFLLQSPSPSCACCPAVRSGCKSCASRSAHPFKTGREWRKRDEETHKRKRSHTKFRAWPFIKSSDQSSWLSWLERWSHRMTQFKVGISKGREFEPHRGPLAAPVLWLLFLLTFVLPTQLAMFCLLFPLGSPARLSACRDYRHKGGSHHPMILQLVASRHQTA